MKKWIGLTVIVLFVAGAAVAWSLYQRHAKLYPSTDNAYVAGDIYQISSQIPGTILTLSVNDNQPVTKDQIVATIDPAPYDRAVDEAQAALAQANTVPATNRAGIAQAEADVQAAASSLDLARTDLDRFEELVKRDSVPKQTYDQALNAEQVAEARYQAKLKVLAAQRAALTVSEKAVESAQAALAAAQLRRSYCTIVTPVAGIVSKRTALAGEVVSAGQPLLAVVPLHSSHLWIEANFKETQLARIRPGQPVTFTADADPSRVYHGKVESLSAGTGAAFSLLPPENATGNWVKVVQRLPVRIAVDEDLPAGEALRLGLSVVVTVDTTGDEQHPASAAQWTTATEAPDGEGSQQ